MGLYEIGIIVLSIFLIAAALFAISQKNLLMAVLGSSVVSLILSIFFFILHAPDVALTEAAIGVALSTFIFIIALRKTENYEEEE